MTLIVMGRRRGASAAYEYLRPTVALPTGTSFNASTGRVEGDVYAPTFPTQTGTVHLVANESQFTTALTNAVRGDTIRLTADITLTAQRTLPNPSGAGWVVIEGDTLPSTAYGAGIVTSAEVTAMRRLIIGFGSGVGLQAPSTTLTRLWIRGIHFACDTTSRSFLQFINIRDTSNPTDNGLFPDEVVIDRCGFSGPSSGDVSQRAVTLNTRRSRVTGCRFVDIIASGSENKAVAFWEGSGPYQIDWNYMEATGMSVLIGGTAMAGNVDALVPSDVLLRRNHMIKPYRWNQHHPDYNAATYSRITAQSKNCFELKVGRRVCLTENVFEGAYESAQTGWAVLLKQDGNGQTAQVTSDVLTYLNRAINCNRAFGVSMDGLNQTSSSPIARLHFVANVASNGNATTLASNTASHTIILVPAETSTAVTTYNVTFSDWAWRWNTIVAARIGSQGFEFSGGPDARRKIDGLTITDTIAWTPASISPTNGIGFMGGGAWNGHGNPTLTANASTLTVERVLAVGNTCTMTNYPTPATSYNEATVGNVGFTNYDSDLTIASGTYATAGAGGRPLGAPVALLTTATTGVRQT